MAKQITISDKESGKAYKLEYSRKSVQLMEQTLGFVLDEIDSKPMTMIPLLFQGAFLMHHRTLSPEKIQSIYDTLPNKEELIGALGEMYGDTFNTLMDDPKGPKEKNGAWTKSW